MSEKKGNTKVLISSIVISSVLLFSVLFGFETYYRNKAGALWQEKAKQEETEDSDSKKSEKGFENYFKDYTQGDVSF